MTQNAAQRRALYKGVRTLDSLVESMNRVCAMRGTHGKQFLNESDLSTLKHLAKLGQGTLSQIETYLEEMK